MSDDEIPDDPFDAVEGEPGDTSVTDSGPVRRLFDGGIPGPSVSELQADYNLQWHWATCLRGCCRVATGSGVPPIFEIGLGGSLGIADYMNDGTALDETPGERPQTQDTAALGPREAE